MTSRSKTDRVISQLAKEFKGKTLSHAQCVKIAKHIAKVNGGQLPPLYALKGLTQLKKSIHARPILYKKLLKKKTYRSDRDDPVATLMRLARDEDKKKPYSDSDWVAFAKKLSAINGDKLPKNEVLRAFLLKRLVWLLCYRPALFAGMKQETAWRPDGREIKPMTVIE